MPVKKRDEFGMDDPGYDAMDEFVGTTRYDKYVHPGPEPKDD